MLEVVMWSNGGAVYFGNSRLHRFPFMLQLITILNYWDRQSLQDERQ